MFYESNSFSNHYNMETNEVLKQSSPVQTGLKRAKHFAVFTAIVLFASGLLLNAQPTSEELNSNENHELTIYVLKSASPLNWESPEMLYKTYRNSVLTNFLKKEER